jgi:hypothetical protein
LGSFSKIHRRGNGGNGGYEEFPTPVIEGMSFAWNLEVQPIMRNRVVEFSGKFSASSVSSAVNFE